MTKLEQNARNYVNGNATLTAKQKATMHTKLVEKGMINLAWMVAATN